MAQTWKSAVILGLFGTALAVGCKVTVDDDDDTSGGAGAGADGGTGGTAGSSSGKGGSGGSSGTAGSSSGGKGGSGGSSGSASGGNAGSGTSGSTSDAGGGGMGDDTTPTCDPDTGDLNNEPYPNCTAADSGNDCEVCVQEQCCDLSKECFSFNPGNVCGWGGPDEDGEIFCYQECILAIVEANGLCDLDDEDECIAMCTTDGCGQIGNQTQAMAECMWTNCSDDCFGTEACE